MKEENKSHSFINNFKKKDILLSIFLIFFYSILFIRLLVNSIHRKHSLLPFHQTSFTLQSKLTAVVKREDIVSLFHHLWNSIYGSFHVK